MTGSPNTTSSDITPPLGPDMLAALSSITGTVLRVREFGDDGWCIVELTGSQTAIGHREEGELALGVAYRFFGQWGEHPKFGRQFAFDSFVLAGSQSREGVLAYLTRTLPPILSRRQAEQAWRFFGTETLRTLRESPNEVAATGLVGEPEALRLAARLQEMAREEPARIALFELFAGRGFPRGVVRACIQEYGVRAPEIIRRNPYRLLVDGIPGIGFARADKLFLDMGGSPRRLKRQTLAAWHALANASDGHTWEGAAGMSKAILAAVGAMDGCDFHRAIRLGVRAKWIAERCDGDTGVRWFAEAGNAHAEATVARIIRRMGATKPDQPWPTIDAAADDVSQHQASEVARFAGRSVGLLLGTPGTGKTRTAAALLRRVLKRAAPDSVAVCAPTGKAAVRITEAMRKNGLDLTATTIHRLLKPRGVKRGVFTFVHGPHNPLRESVFVVDETSMVDVSLMAAFLSALPPRASVLFVGDPYQLPPVGHGAPLRDLIAAGVPSGLLTEIHRNAGRIVEACSEIKSGAFAWLAQPDADGANLRKVDIGEADAQRTMVGSLVRAAADAGIDPVWQTQVLVPRNDKTPVSRRELNRMLQAVLNPADETLPAAYRHHEFRIGDKVVCLRNDEAEGVALDRGSDPRDAASYKAATPSKHTSDFDGDDDQAAASCYLANGDMGRVVATSPTAIVVEWLDPFRRTKVQTKKASERPADERAVTSGIEESTAEAAKGNGKDGERKGGVDIDLAYALTVHKSQGSEWPVVIVVLDESANRLLSREWLYTAISRAAKRCFMIGTPRTAAKAIRNTELSQRRTFLAEQIRQTKGGE